MARLQAGQLVHIGDELTGVNCVRGQLCCVYDV